MNSAGKNRSEGYWGIIIIITHILQKINKLYIKILLDLAKKNCYTYNRREGRASYI